MTDAFTRLVRDGYNPIYDPVVSKVLEEVRKDYPDAFIGGGYLRDRIMGYDPNDIDVFTFLQPKETENDAGVDRAATYNVKRIVYVASRVIQEVNIPIQIVFLDGSKAADPNAAIRQFALGIQQVGYAGGMLNITEAFWRDFRDNTLTVMYCEDFKEASAIAYKISELWRADKFVGWPVKEAIKCRVKYILGDEDNGQSS